MFSADKSHGHASGMFISPEGWRTLAGGNTPGKGPLRLRPGGALESNVGYPIRLISPIRLLHNAPTCHRLKIRPENKGIKPKSNRHKPKNFIMGRCPKGHAVRKGHYGVCSSASTVTKAQISQAHSRLFKPVPAYSSVFAPPRGGIIFWRPSAQWLLARTKVGMRHARKPLH
jgi:hypothetical protein